MKRRVYASLIVLSQFIPLDVIREHVIPMLPYMYCKICEIPLQKKKIENIAWITSDGLSIYCKKCTASLQECYKKRKKIY
jgi:hypothetical protein